MEIWKLINGTDWYEVSNEGRVRRIGHYRTHTRKNGKTYQVYYKEMIMNATSDQDGYMAIGLFYSKSGEYKYPSVHRLVAEHFLFDWDPRLQVNHKNGDKSDNHVENLEMATCQENIDHFWNHPAMEERRKQKLIRISIASREVMSRPEVKIAESEKQGKHVLCIEDNIAFSSRTVCAKFYKVGYDLIDGRCKNGYPKKTPYRLPNKSFRYLSEEEYQSFKKENLERVIMYV